MNTTTTEQKIERLIERDILANQTHLVETLLIKANPDWIDYAENLYDESPETIEEYLTYETEIGPETWGELDSFERHDLAIKYGFEPSPQEIFEWWLVSDWLADKLSQFEEPVLRTAYGTWWGRTTTGQAIKLDYVMRKIAETTG